MKAWLHKLAHWTGWNRGIVVAATDRRGLVWVGFRCQCGKLSGKHMGFVASPADEDFR